MPTFNNALFISFMAEDSEDSSNISTKSYYKTKEPLNSSIYLYRQNQEKNEFLPSWKKDHGHRIPFCHINYAYSSDDYLQVDKNLNNKTKANKTMAHFLKKVTPYTIIYLFVHGSSDKNLIQKVLKDDKSIIIPIPINDLVDVLSKYIPKAAKKHIILNLISCYGHGVTEDFMFALSSKGFRNSCVVGYNDVVEVTFGVGKNSNRIYSFALKEPIVDASDRTCSHNYEMGINTIDYDLFKKKYLINCMQEKENKELFLVLLSEVCSKVQEYINLNRRHGKLHWYHKHSRSGIGRAKLFYDGTYQIYRDIAENIINDNYKCFTFEKQFIQQIHDFTNKNGDYGNFSGGIKVNPSSCLTFIIIALDKFINKRFYQVKSLGFRQFIKYIFNDNKWLSQTDTERVRQQIRARIINISHEKLIKWYPEEEKSEGNNSFFQ